MEIMEQCSECLFQGCNKTYADLLPMEFTDGHTRLTHIVAALSISDQQEADKLLGDPLYFHVCTVPEFHYLTPEVIFPGPVRTALPVLKKDLDAAEGYLMKLPRLLIGCAPKGYCIWLDTLDKYCDARHSTGGVHHAHCCL